MTNLTKIVVTSFLILSLAGLIFFIGAVFFRKQSLPVLGEPGHIAGPFTFTNQNGQIVTEHDVMGKTTVVEYFFTTCPGICKVMNKNLSRVANTFQNQPDFLILSHTVNPDTDSVPVLNAYAHKLGAAAGHWIFLTGDKQKLYTAARNDYLLAVEDATPGNISDDFIHTEKVALLDNQRQIRGFYDATDSISVDKLIRDVGVLLKN